MRACISCVLIFSNPAHSWHWDSTGSPRWNGGTFPMTHRCLRAHAGPFRIKDLEWWPQVSLRIWRSEDYTWHGILSATGYPLLILIEYNSIGYSRGTRCVFSWLWDVYHPKLEAACFDPTCLYHGTSIWMWYTVANSPGRWLPTCFKHCVKSWFHNIY